ncbi:MAG: outer membrane homotrimeric porin [Desulfovibrionaceae bacterium]|nr:outer membrane homotrimeric porin [Desulfovibrionaceae bacterium]
MKKLVTLLLAAGLVFSASTSAQAIDFKASGEWLMGFGLGDSNLVNRTRVNGEAKKKTNTDDKFTAAQRVRLQLEAVASENLSGTVLFELLETTWGKAENSGALGADDTGIGVLNAFIDWAVPDTDLKVRMGIQPVELPNVAGGSSILNTDALAAVTLSYQFNDNVGATLFWGRPYNDNYTGNGVGSHKTNYLDNVDLIALSVPLTFDGVSVTPWVMYGLIGKNALRATNDDGYVGPSDLFAVNDPTGLDNRHLSRAYGNAFWGGIATALTLWDPLNIELDLNYGYVQGMGSYDLSRSDGVTKRADLGRQGFLAKALVEYKMDWGTPGIFAWYGTGDDDNPKNGSERLPSVEAKGNFTSMMGDDNYGWGSNGSWYDMTLNYAGTWGVGLQIKDMSFLENLSHTFRVAYWAGTNSPSMAKYASSPISWNNQLDDSTSDSLYLTTMDSLLEFNLINKYQMYENFEVNFELGYMVNFFDNDTWKKANHGSCDTYEKRDAWKAQLIFAYSF